MDAPLIAFEVSHAQRERKRGVEQPLPPISGTYSAVLVCQGPPNLYDQHTHRDMHVDFVVRRQLQLAPLVVDLEHVTFDRLFKHRLHPDRFPLVLLQRLAALGLTTVTQREIVTSRSGETGGTCSRTKDARPGYISA